MCMHALYLILLIAMLVNCLHASMLQLAMQIACPYFHHAGLNSLQESAARVQHFSYKGEIDACNPFVKCSTKKQLKFSKHAHDLILPITLPQSSSMHVQYCRAQFARKVMCFYSFLETISIEIQFTLQKLVIIQQKRQLYA